MFDIERVVAISDAKSAMYSPHGYVIKDDGKVYTLLRQWWHGAVMAMLYPDHLKEFRLDAEDEDGNVIPGTGTVLEIPETPDDLNVFDFQKFEHAYHSKLPVVRICPTRMMSPPSVDLPEDGCTPVQAEALRVVLVEILGMDLRDEVAMDHSDVPVKLCCDLARIGRDARDDAKWAYRQAVRGEEC